MLPSLRDAARTTSLREQPRRPVKRSPVLRSTSPRKFPESAMATPATGIAVAVIDFWLQS
ncbi:MAG: hypothetical protein V7K47_19910 [Nostoc sp.]